MAHGTAQVFPNGTAVHSFAFDHTTEGLATGVVAFTPTVGDIIFDAWIEVDTAFNGTTPTGDLGSFTGDPAVGWYRSLSGGAVIDMTQADVTSLSDPILLQQVPNAPNSDVNIAYLYSDNSRAFPAKFVSDAPVKFALSQDGTITSANAFTVGGTVRCP